MNQDADIFSKVSDQEKTRLFKDLAANRTEIVCKGDGDQIYYFVAQRTTPRQELVCSIPFGIPRPPNGDAMVCNFFIGGERYFFKTMVFPEAESVRMQTNNELFHLQRRQNYRIKIPESYAATFLITEHRNSAIKLSGALYDISIGGCRVILPASTPVLAIGDQVTGHVHISKRESIETEGVIRHHKMEKFAGRSPEQTFGVEFKELSSLIEGRLFAITMDLHREFFSRLNTKS